MADIVTPEFRSRMMRGIRGKDTKPEVLLRKLLFASGLRFRLHRKDLPGKPDLVLPKWNAAVFVHGCFWHRHEGCSLAATPGTRTEFWRCKFEGNVKRDARNRDQLLAARWRVATVWECGLRKAPEHIATEVTAWLITNEDRHAEFPDLNASDAHPVPLLSGGRKRRRAVRRRIPAADL
ncbi:MAG: very short patch repair endonuclease [Blastocatellales bacterium]